MFLTGLRYIFLMQPISDGTSRHDSGQLHDCMSMPSDQSVLRKRHAKKPELPTLGSAPLRLERPLSLFGALPVCFSSPLAIDPDTLLRVVCGRGLLEVVRNINLSFIALLRKMSYVDKKKHKPSLGFKKHVIAEFAPLAKAVPREEIERVLDDPQYKMEGPRSSWADILLTLQTEDDQRTTDFLGKVCHWMMACDLHGLYVRDLVNAGEMAKASAHIHPLIAPAAEAWERLNRRLNPLAIIPLEVPLMALVRLDCEGHVGDGSLALQQPFLVHYLAPGTRPIGHWLKEVCKFSKCKNLGELARALSRAGADYQEGPVNHERLKKWSRSKEVVMPAAAVNSVLMAMSAKVSRDVMKDRFYATRFLTFACDLTCSATRGEAPTWGEAQAQIKRRYEDLYRRQSALVTV